MHRGGIAAHFGNFGSFGEGGVGDKWSGDGGIIGDEPPVVATFSQEGPQRSERVGKGPIADDGGVFRRDLDSQGADLVPEVLDLVPEELSLVGRDLESGGPEGSEHLAEDGEVSLGSSGVDSSVIQVAQGLGGRDVAQGFGYQPGVRGRGVGQTEGHPFELKLSKRGGEGCLLSVGSSHRNCVKCTSPIEGREDLTTCQSREVVGDIWEWVGVLLGDGVELPVVDCPSEFIAVLLRHRHKWEGPRGVGLFHHILVEPFIQLLPQGSFHRRVKWTMLDLDGVRSRLQVDGMRDQVCLPVTPYRNDI